MPVSAARRPPLHAALPASAATCVPTDVTPKSVTLGTTPESVTFDVKSVEQEDARAAGAPKAADSKAARLFAEGRARVKAEGANPKAAQAPRAQDGCLEEWLVVVVSASDEVIGYASNDEPTF